MTWVFLLVAAAFLGAIAWNLKDYRPSRHFVLNRKPETRRWDRLLPEDRLEDIYRAAYNG